MKQLFENKKLVFLEKDCDCPNSRDSIESAKMFLDTYLGLSDDVIDAMEIHFSIGNLERDKLYELLFNPNHVIVTFSVYIQGSDSLFMSLMAAAGRNKIKGITYIDSSGSLKEFLNRRLSDSNHWADIATGINCNNILSIDYRESDLEVQLLKIYPMGSHNLVKCLKLIPENIL